MVDNKQIKKINRFLQARLIQKYGVTAVAILVVGSVAYFGTHLNRNSHAATGGVLTMAPATGTLTQGANVTVTLSEDSGTDPVNAVQASVTYDATKLQYVSLAEGTAFPSIAATSTATPGVIRVGRGTAAPNSVTGSNTIVTVTFKVLGSSGTTDLTFDPAFSFIVRSTDSVNILTTNTGSTFGMKLPTPTVSTVAPTSGPTAGGTAITISGTNFVSGASVTVGGAPATNVVFVSATSLTATVPAHAAGAVNVVVTNPDGQVATKAGGYTYVAPAPAVASISPASGTTAGGTSVTVTGTSFVSGATVKVGGTAASSVVFVSSTSLTAVTPAHAAGAAQVVVTNPDGQSTPNSTVNYTYVIPAPTVTSVSPTSGPSSGGTQITITGANFASITGVTVGGVAASSVTTVSPTTITALTPAHASGVVAIAVTNTTGTGTLGSAYTYRNPAPTVSSIAPTAATANGGTLLTISGSNFASGATVSVGGSAATNVVVVNASTITATAPVHASGLVGISVTNSDGQTGTLANSFTYLALGDANNDGRVNAIDLSILISHDAQNYPPADFNGDGTVGSADMAILLARWTW